MERRVLLAIFMSFVVLYAYQALFVRPAPKPDPSSSTTPVPTSVATPPSSPVPPAETSPTPAAPSSGAIAIVSDSMERDTRIETLRVSAVLTNRGGRLKSWRLKQFRDKRG